MTTGERVGVHRSSAVLGAVVGGGSEGWEERMTGLFGDEQRNKIQKRKKAKPRKRRGYPPWCRGCAWDFLLGENLPPPVQSLNLIKWNQAPGSCWTIWLEEDPRSLIL